MVHITVNGEAQQIDRPQKVTELLETLKVNPRQVAVAVNGEVVTRSTWPDVIVSEGDVVEIVRAVGGGAA